MAATAKRKKNTPRKKSVQKKTSKSINKSITNEIILLGILAVCILMLLSNFGLIGAAGKMISYVQFGIFGLVAYIIPVVIFIVISFLVSNKGNKVAYLKIAGVVLLFINLSAFIQFVSDSTRTGYTISQYYHNSGSGKNGGGVLGGLLSHFLYETFGSAGTVVITITIMLICVVLITERSLFSGVKKGSNKVYQSAREDYIRRKEKQAENKDNSEKHEIKAKKENNKIFRMQKKVSGVAIDTTIPKENEEMEDMHEITFDFKDDIPKPQESEIRFDDVENFITKEVITESTINQNHTSNIVETPKPEIKQTEAVSKQSADSYKSQNSDNKEISDNKENREYKAPPLSLLKNGQVNSNINKNGNKNVKETALKLQQTLHNFGVSVTITNVSCGPTVTRYELQPEQGVKVSRILSLSDDIKLNLAASDIRIEAPIPGKAAIGIEVPNKDNTAVMLRDLLESEEFRNHPSKLAFAAGKDIGGQTVVTDVAKMPHLLIAGATGSGKSVCINTLIMSILYKASPDEVKLIMIDPKVVELSVYNGIPHLMIPVVTDPKKAAGALNWAVVEMTDRYQKFAQYNVRDMKSYNEKIDGLKDIEADDKPKKLPQIVIIVDELADLMMVAPGEVEESICRLAQLARAAGIHLILATQRPSVNVITGLIKANMPSRIAFSVSSGVDSRTILDMNGAEKLLGKGDMLFYPQGYAKPVRVQGSFVSDSEVTAVVKYLTTENKDTVTYAEMEDKIINNTYTMMDNGSNSDRDTYFAEAGKFIIEKDKASIGLLQRAFKIGFNRAARIMDQLAEAGVVGEEEGTKPRKILMTMEEFELFIDEYV